MHGGHGHAQYNIDFCFVQKLYPLMNVDDVYGCLYSPKDGTIDPSGAWLSMMYYMGAWVYFRAILRSGGFYSHSTT